MLDLQVNEPTAACDFPGCDFDPKTDVLYCVNQREQHKIWACIKHRTAVEEAHHNSIWKKIGTIQYVITPSDHDE